MSFLFLATEKNELKLGQHLSPSLPVFMFSAHFSSSNADSSTSIDAPELDTEGAGDDVTTEVVDVNGSRFLVPIVGEGKLFSRHRHGGKSNGSTLDDALSCFSRDLMADQDAMSLLSTIQQHQEAAASGNKFLEHGLNKKLQLRMLEAAGKPNTVGGVPAARGGVPWVASGLAFHWPGVQAAASKTTVDFSGGDKAGDEESDEDASTASSRDVLTNPESIYTAYTTEDGSNGSSDDSSNRLAIFGEKRRGAEAEPHDIDVDVGTAYANREDEISDNCSVGSSTDELHDRGSDDDDDDYDMYASNKNNQRRSSNRRNSAGSNISVGTLQVCVDNSDCDEFTVYEGGETPTTVDGASGKRTPTRGGKLRGILVLPQTPPAAAATRSTMSTTALVPAAATSTPAAPGATSQPAAEALAASANQSLRRINLLLESTERGRRFSARPIAMAITILDPDLQRRDSMTDALLAANNTPQRNSMFYSPGEWKSAHNPNSATPAAAMVSHIWM